MIQPVLFRRYTAENVARTDARTLTGRAVPYDVAAPVTDLLPDGTYETYREGFRPTAFAHEIDQPHRVRLLDGHGGPEIGVGAAMRSTDGLDVDFRLLTEADAERVETLLDVGVGDLSVGFKPCRGGTVIDPDGTRWRTKALLLHVALEPSGAYPGAEVLALRADSADLEAAAETEYEEYVAGLDDYLRAQQARQAELDALLARRESPPAE